MRRFIAVFAVLLLPAPAAADGYETEPGYASFARTTILARYADLEPSITFWRDVMGFTYTGDPRPTTGSSSPIGWDEEAVRYFTAFSSKGGSTVALLMIEDDPDFPAVTLPESGAAIGGSVLVHTAKNLEDLYNRAVANDVTILKPYGPSVTGRSMQIYLRAPTGQLVEIYEMIPQLAED
ncbi:MAG: VOC family protein [Rhodospirillaceae bacterium]